MKLLCAGESEELKACVHGTIGTLAAVSCVYNVAVLSTRGNSRHFGNSLFYGLLAALEWQKVKHHLEQR